MTLTFELSGVSAEELRETARQVLAERETPLPEDAVFWLEPLTIETCTTVFLRLVARHARTAAAEQ